MQIMKDKFNSIVIVGCIVASGIILAGCESSHTEEEGKKEIVAAPAAYTEVFSLSKDKLSTSLQMPGELQAFQQVDLYAKVNSFVKKLYVDLGSEVKAGQLLAVMEAPEMEAQVSAAQSRLKSQEAVYIASKASYDRLYEIGRAHV